MIQVEVKDLALSKIGFVVLLKEVNKNRILPIYIGPPEAQAIMLPLNNIEVPRPMSHVLFKNILDAVEARLEHAIIVAEKNSIFYAKIVFQFEGQELEVDARPSDAIALCLRCHTPIYVTEQVMKNKSITLGKDKHETFLTEEKILNSIEILKKNLENAIKEERYEDAAMMRDQIKKANSHN